MRPRRFQRLAAGARRALLRPVFRAKPNATRRERGVALIVVAAIISVLSALVLDFNETTNRELAAAAHTRDEVRAEVLARSGANLGRLLVKFQQAFLDRARNLLHADIQIGDYAGLILEAFSGSKSDVAGLETMLGLPASKTKGLGLDEDAGTFTVAMSSEDGKINVNCAGTGPAAQAPVALRLAALFAPQRYDVLFSTPDLDGQITDRLTLVAAIIDWIDMDTAYYGNPGAPEDYGYDRFRDPYKSHDNFVDSPEELRMVRGMNDDVWSQFGAAFTAWGGCKVNVSALGADDWPMIASIILQSASNPDDPVIHNEVALVGLAQRVAGLRALIGGFFDLNTFAQAVQNPGLLGQLGSQLSGSLQTSGPTAQFVQGVQLDMGKLGQIAEAGPRRVYRIEATGTAGRVDRKIIAIYDTQKMNSNATDLAYRQGSWVYWREE